MPPVVRVCGAVVAALVLSSIFLTAQRGQAQSARKHQRDQELSKHFNRHEVISLQAADAAAQVLETGRLAIDTAHGTFDMDLVAHDMRAPQYRAEEVGADGVTRPLEAGPVSTYRGTLRGREGARVRLTLDGSMAEGMIVDGAERYYIEPARRYSAAAEAEDFVFYSAADVIQDQPIECGLTMEDRVNVGSGHVSQQAAAQLAPAPFSPFRLLEVATEADYSYVTKLGGSAAANAQILSTMNIVEGVYEAELGVTFQITYQHAWASEDPFTAVTAPEYLAQFTGYWANNMRSVQRDIAHAWNGQSWSDFFAGYAYVGVVCKSLGYGVSARTSFPFQYSIVAHEIGHNFGASHGEASGGSCGQTIMNSTPGSSLTFCQYSRDEMLNYASANSSCLTQLPAACGSVILSSTTKGLRAAESWSGTVTVVAGQGCPWTASSDSGWLTVEPVGGASGPGLLNLNAAPNTGLFRVGKVTVGNQTFTVSQEGAAASCAPPAPQAGFWRAEGNGNDSAGTNNAKLASNVTFAPGKVGQAFSYNSTGGIVFAEGAGLPTGGADRSVQFWMKAGTQPHTNNIQIVYYGDFQVTISALSAQQVALNFNGGYLAVGLPQPTEWHHVAVTYQAGVAALYLDGLPIMSSAVSLNTAAGQRFFIGRSDYNGLLDEVAVYNRALTPVEVHSLYAAGSKGVCGAANQIDGSQFFVRQHYLDFLGREPDGSGLAFWTGGIDSCGADAGCRDFKRVDTSAAFFLSIEFQQTGYLAYRTYKAAYGDAFDASMATADSPQGFPAPVIRRSEFAADTPVIASGVQVGIGDWEQKLETNKQSFMLAFVQRTRFTSAFPASMTADAFVTKLDQNAGGVLSDAEKAALVAALGTTPSDPAKRAQVLRSVAEDADLQQREFNRAFVLMQYYGYLRRDPNGGQDTNFAGYKFWLDKLNAFAGDFRQAEMVKAFLDSIEYRQRFGQ